jgi:acyl-coenzyme A synthetase/AMP-(fatty) acid ligase
LVMAPHETRHDVARLIETVVTNRITTLQVVPALLKLLVDDPAFARCRSLRRVFCGGDRLPADTVARFFETLDAQLCNLYGPTEACIDAAFHVCDAQHKSRSVPIGRPIANTRLYILDTAGNPVPIGVCGELYVAGEGLGRGYWNQPALTDEKFVLSGAGERMYRTGDTARFGRDGLIEFLGRRDRQLKVRGFRIEPGEVEAILVRHPAVRDVVVVAREDASETSALVAYVVPAAAHQPAAGELRRFLGEQVPEHAIPSTFIVIDELPLSPSGKVDTRALPDPDTSRPALSAAGVQPRTRLERTIAAVWQEVLGISQVGVEDNFFDLGGHSLLIMRVYARLRELLPVVLNVIDLFRYPTVGALAAFVAHALQENGGEAEHPDDQHVLPSATGDESLLT